MKKMRKFISVVLAIAVVMSSLVAVFAEETTTAGSDSAVAATGSLSDVKSDAVYYDAVKTLNAMGVIKGYEDGSFKPDQNVTRAEFTAMLMRMLKLGSIGNTSAAELPFTDIDDNDSDINWAIPDINTAYAKKTINGYEDGTFRPSANVAYEEAVKMIVCTLGYVASVDVDPWYANYTSIANQKGITKIASKIGAPETPATRACIAQLLYDSLDVKIVENEEITNKTILNDYLGYEKATGVIYSNDVTSLESADINLRSNEIMIYAKEPDTNVYETHTYVISDNSLKDYIGHQLDFYYTSTGSDPRTMMISVLKNTEPLVISAANIETSLSSNTQIKYYQNLDDNKEKSANISSDNVVIYNGKLYGSTARNSRFDTSMIPVMGQVKLIDSDADNTYDVVEITDYDVYYVSSKSSTSYEIIDNVIQPAENKTLKLDKSADPNLSIVNKNGSEIDFGSISVGNIICYTKTNSGSSLKKAIVLSDKVTGTITAIQNDKLTISGKEYRISDAAPWLTGGKLDEAPQNQDSGTYYLDLNGDIVAYTKDAVSTNTYYGYIVAYVEDRDSFDGDVTFRVLNSSGSTVYIKTYKSTSVNGRTRSTGTAVLEALRDALDNGKSGAEGVQQLIKYTTKTVSGENVFDKIYTASDVDKGGDVVADKLNRLSTITKEDSASYSTSSKTLSYDGTKVNLSNAIVFVVPKDGKYNNFRKSTVSSTFTTDTNSCKVEVFDVSSASVPKVVVAYGVNSSQKISDSSAVCVLTDISEAKNDDQSMKKLKGYKSTGSTPKGTFDSMWVSPDSDKDIVDSLSKGDIFRAGLDDDGYTLFEDDDANTDLIYQVDGDNTFGLFGKISDSSQYGLILGSVVAKDESAISIAPEELSKDSESYGDVQLFNVSDFSGAQILVYDNTGKNLEINEVDGSEYAAAIDALNAYDDGVEPSKVLVYIYKRSVKLLVVLPD